MKYYKVDKSTEIWLGQIEEKLSYKKWYCGHYHTEKKIDRLEIMFNNFDEFSAAPNNQVEESYL